MAGEHLLVEGPDFAPGVPPARRLGAAFRITWAAFLFLTAISASASGREKFLHYTGPVSALRIASADVGPGWSGPTGLVIDDLNDLDRHPPSIRPMLDRLARQMAPLGVTASADFTYRRKGATLEQVTIRVFIFESLDTAQAWWLKRYRADGWQRYDAEAEGAGESAADSTQMTKRAIRVGNILFTAGALSTTEDHLRILGLYLKRLRSIIAQER